VPKLHSIEKRVKEILINHVKARNSDRYLIAAYLEIYEGITTFKEYYQATNLNKDAVTVESIRRCRQKIQARKELMPTKHEVLIQRGMLTKVYKSYALSPAKP